MKKILIFLLILLPAINAKDIDILPYKNDYNFYETFQADIFINLNLTEKITASNFALKNINNKTIPISVFLESLSSSHYFVYFDIPKLENGTYYFSIKDVKYSDGILKKASYSKKVYISNSSSISIFPAIFNNLNSAKLTIINHNSPINVSIISDELNLTMNFYLIDKKEITIDIPSNLEDFKIRINYDGGFYSIPVVSNKVELKYDEKIDELLINTSSKNSIILLNSTYGNYFEKKIFITKDSTPNGPFYVINNNSYGIILTFNLTSGLKNILRLNSTTAELKPNEVYTQYVWLNENQNPSKLNYAGYITIVNDNEIISSLPIEVEFLEDYKPNLTKKEENQNISNNTVKDEPKIKEKNSDYLAFASLALIILIFLALIYKLLKKNKPKDDFEEFIKS